MSILSKFKDCQKQKTILIVDDKPNNLQLLFKYLKDAGYKILVSQNGTIAMETAIEVHPDLILLDVMMSGLNGFETCKRLKINPQTQDIPVIFMTALADTVNKVKGFNLGAVDYITKPIDRDELLARVNIQLTLQNLTQRLAEEAKQQKLLFEISDRIRQSLDLNLIFQTATDEILQFLQCDRVVLAHVTKNQTDQNQIEIEAQSIVTQVCDLLPPSLNVDYFWCDPKIDDSACQRGNCQQGDFYQLDNIDNLAPTSNKFQILSQFQTKAQLVLPIVLNNTQLETPNDSNVLWGWLVADVCQHPKRWQKSEIDLLRHLVIQLTIGIQQGLLYQQLHQSNQTLKRLALCDPLTQVFNRRYFDRQLNQEWRRLKRIPSPLSLIMCDVDCFKAYNDTYGHRQGDRCLRDIANTLANFTKRPADILARYGGEEFVVILPYTPAQGAIKVAESMRVAVKELNLPHTHSTCNSVVTISVGVASTTPNSQDKPAMLVEAADQALYLAKNRGRNCVAVYQHPISQSKSKQIEELQWSKRIRKALTENLFSLYAQPIASLNSDDHHQYFEILLRLKDRGDQAIAPNSFLDIAARQSLMPSIDTWVIDHLFSQLAQSKTQDWENHRFSINLSGASLNDDSFLNFLSQKLADYHLPPHLFCFEITETVAIANLTTAANFIKSLKNIGCSFALDDFGKGMSSLTYLKHLPLDYLKIDGSFITELNNDKMSRAMVEAIHHLAGAIGLKTIAEFVENQAILDTLKDLKIDYAQGYHLARPAEFANVVG